MSLEDIVSQFVDFMFKSPVIIVVLQLRIILCFSSRSSVELFALVQWYALVASGF